MLNGKTVFAQLISFLPRYQFKKCVKRYRGNHKVRKFSCWDQFLPMVFAQLIFRSSLRSTVSILNSRRGNIPSFNLITDGKFHDVYVLDVIIVEPGSFYIMDRAYNDFSRLYQINLLGAFFVVRAKKI